MYVYIYIFIYIYIYIENKKKMHLYTSTNRTHVEYAFWNNQQKAARLEIENKKKPKRRKALTTTAWISFADDDPEERFDYCGEMVRLKIKIVCILVV